MEYIEPCCIHECVDHQAAYEIAHVCFSILREENGVDLFNLCMYVECSLEPSDIQHRLSRLPPLNKASMYIESNVYTFSFNYYHIILNCDYLHGCFHLSIIKGILEPNNQPIFTCSGEIIKDLGLLLKVWEYMRGDLPDSFNFQWNGRSRENGNDIQRDQYATRKTQTFRSDGVYRYKSFTTHKGLSGPKKRKERRRIKIYLKKYFRRK